MDDMVRQLQEELAHVRRERDGWMAQIGKVAALVPIPDVVKYTGTTGDLIRWLTSRVAAADEAAAALTEAQATIARLEAALRIVADGPVAGEILEPWIRYRMREARAALSPGKGE